MPITPSYKPTNREFKETLLIHIVDSFENIFSDSINSQILDLKEEISSFLEEADKFEPELEDFKKSDREDPTEEELELIMEQTSYLYDVYLRKQQLQALTEMKIIYYFKSLEILLKKILEVTYDSKEASKIFGWDDIKSGFKEEGIFISKIDGYNETVELKNVNNNLKHSSKIHSSVKASKEFHDMTFFKFEELSKFYRRVKLPVKSFFDSLSMKLVNDVVNAGT